MEVYRGDAISTYFRPDIPNCAPEQHNTKLITGELTCGERDSNRRQMNPFFKRWTIWLFCHWRRWFEITNTEIDAFLFPDAPVVDVFVWFWIFGNISHFSMHWKYRFKTTTTFHRTIRINGSTTFVTTSNPRLLKELHRSINKFPPFDKRWCHQYVMVKIVCCKTSYHRIGHLVTT